ncbi:3-deoxy-D-manno-octulosonic acid transferase [Celeribacter halophilus]|uniref:3-deoxy-D-manno-octulosonic acid transferase n=1 Tax=Celeribacter halophilus TaxID=576117 RepID=UPI003A92F031
MAKPFPYLLYSALSRKSERHHVDQLDRLVASGAVTQAAYDQRLVRNQPKRPKGELIWLHAATPYALRPAMELFHRICEDRPDLSGLITIAPDMTPPAGAEDESLYFSRLPEDDSTTIRRFLARWTPDSLVWVGGRFRPNLLRITRDCTIPAIAIDAPNSAASLDIPLSIPGLRKHVLGCFDHVFAATADATLPWRRAGIPDAKIDALGHLEEGGRAPGLDEETLARRMAEIGTRPSWFAAQLERSEVGEIIRAHKRALRRAHRLLLTVSLSNHAVTDSVLTQFQNAGMTAVALDQSTPIPESAQVVIVPQADGNGLWHRISPISFMGRSFGPFGGIDPYPATAMGSAILHGKNVSDYTTAYARLAAAKAARSVHDGYELGEEVGRLMSPDQAALMAGAAWEVASTGTEVTDRVANLVQDFLDLRERTEA